MERFVLVTGFPSGWGNSWNYPKVGHVPPAAKAGGAIALVEDGSTSTCPPAACNSSYPPTPGAPVASHY